MGTFEGIERRAFTVLVEQPPTALVLGIVGRFWTPRGDLQRVAPEDWVPFDEPGFAKAAWGFSLEALPEGGCRLATETRVWCTDPASRRRFLRYWRIVGPFSGWIRREILRLVRRQSEAAPA